MKNFLIIIALLQFVYLSCSAQKENDILLPKSLQIRDYGRKNPFEQRRIKFAAGGSGNFGIYNQAFSLALSPLIGIYPGIDWLLVGVSGDIGVNYDMYYKDSFFDWGLSGFIRGLIWEQRFIVQVSCNFMNVANYYISPDNRISALAFYAGIGYNQCALSNNRLKYFIVLSFKLINDFDPDNILTFFLPSIGITYDF